MNFIDEKLEYFREKRDSILQKLVEMGIDPKNLQTGQQQLSYQLEGIQSLKDLKVACIMDRFTLDSYSPECRLLELTPDNWKNEIDAFQPDLLFIESAWEGKDKLWYKKIANGSKEYFELTSYCRECNIPIVFWNKEDPIYTDVFMQAAQMADFVFTTDIDCVKKYKDTLKHDRVYFLHFAAQPKVHNPIEKYERKDKYCFAGAYYHRYKKRAEVFDKFADLFIKTKGYDIFDRNYKNSRPEHAFPNRYAPYILGRLEPSQIDIAYKGYNYGVNMNSVDQSQTMFARRVFEMLASNTVTVGNYSRGVKNLFGDLTICTNDSQTLEQALKKWCGDTKTYRKYRLAGLRRVLSSHLYEDRLSYIVEKVFGSDLKQRLPKIVMFAEAQTEDEKENILRCFRQQTYENRELYMIGDGISSLQEEVKVKTVCRAEFEAFSWSQWGKDTYIGRLSGKNYYGPNYLMDLVLTLRYADYEGIGKRGYYVFSDQTVQGKNLDSVYKEITQIRADRGIFQSSYCEQKMDLPKNFLTAEWIEGGHLFAADEFNFCENWCAQSCEEVDDLLIPDQGIEIDKIQKTAEGIRRNLIDGDQGTILSGKDVFARLEKSNDSHILKQPQNEKLFVQSSLSENENRYLYLNQFFDVKEYQQEGKLQLIFEGNGSMEFLGACVFYDSSKKKMEPYFTKANRILSVEIPQKASFFKLALRFRGTGDFVLTSIDIGTATDKKEKGCFLTRSHVLELVNVYPTPDNLYRNMFVHKRLLAYKSKNRVVDVMRMNIYAQDGFCEFEGINIVDGQSEMLANILEHGNIDTVCVHFLDRQMWEVLKHYLYKIRLIIWSHGADIQPWWRRTFNYKTEVDLEKAKKASEERMSLWNEVFSVYEQYKIDFVFVSQYSADLVMEDYKIKFSEERCHIIPNCIDTKLFSYTRKNAEDRKKIISIRPYASRIYGNDLMVNTVLALSKESFFKELQFLIIGDGELFDEVTAPLKKFNNVEMRKTFLRQSDIAELYHQYGVVLIPTRGDTQGVSRDEAMSCGLVPITNRVAAIPEFVDENCGLLAPEEDYEKMANSIKTLYSDPDLYLRLSENAAKRVRRQTSSEFTIDKEIQLIEKQ